MKIGLLSDTHGNIRATIQAALQFEAAGVRAVFHCGDIGGFDVLIELASIFEPLSVPVYGVLGNVDRPFLDHKFLPDPMGIHLQGRFGTIELDGKKIAFLHSDDSTLYQETISSGRFDFVFSGHTHCAHDYMSGNTRCINPGSAGQGRPIASCAIFDLTQEVLTVVAL